MRGGGLNKVRTFFLSFFLTASLSHSLLQSERTQGFAADPVYVKGEVFAYVGLSQNLKDLKLRVSSPPT